MDRIFPTQELLGGEAILARALWEHEVSKQHTPLALGELLQQRTFQANGEPNPLSKRDRTSTMLTPRSVLSILDGLAAVRWAYVLIKIGSEQSIHAFYDWLVRLARSRPQKTDQFGQFYTTTSWKLVLEMRSGKTFEEVTAILMRDYDSFSECVSRDPLQTQKTKPAQAKPAEAKGYGKSNTKSKGHRFQPHRQQWRYSNHDRPQPRQYGAAQEDKSWTREAGSQEWKPPRK